MIFFCWFFLASFNMRDQGNTGFSFHILNTADAGCGTSMSVRTSDRNSVPCTLRVNATISDCYTQAGPVPVNVMITSVSGSAQGFNAFTDGMMVPGSPFAFDPSGITTLEMFLPGDRTMHQIFIHDIGDVSCTAIVPIETPDCSGQSVMDNLSIEFAQPATHFAEIHDFSGVRPLILFPNPILAEEPSFSLLGITGIDYGKTGRLNVYAIRGSLISSSEVICQAQFSFRLQQGIPGGIYFIELNAGQNVYSGKLVIR